MSKITMIDIKGQEAFLTKLESIKKLVPGAVVALYNATEKQIDFCIRAGIEGWNIWDIYSQRGHLNEVQAAIRVYLWPDGSWVSEEMVGEDLEETLGSKSDDYRVIWTLLDGEELEEYLATFK